MDPIRKEKLHFCSADGKTTVYAVTWQPLSGTVCGIVQIVHGIAEHIGRYEAFASFLAQQGYAVYGHDQLGHGQTAGQALGVMPKNARTFLIEDIKKLHSIAQAAHPDKPFFLFGHSLGSCCARVYAQNDPDDLDGLLLCGTGHMPVLMRGTIPALMQKSGSRSPYRGAAVPLSWLSYDKSNQKAYAADPLVARRTTRGMQADCQLIILESCKPGWARSIPNSLPIFIFSGCADVYGVFGYGPRRAYRDLLKSGHPNVTLKLFPHAKHELLQEPAVRDEVLQAVVSWINKTVDAHAVRQKAGVCTETADKK